MSSFNKKTQTDFLKNYLNSHYGLEYVPKILNIKRMDRTLFKPRC